MKKVIMEVSQCWYDLDSNLIKNCFNHCKIMSDGNDNTKVTDEGHEYESIFDEYSKKIESDVIELKEYLGFEDNVDFAMNAKSNKEIIEMVECNNEESDEVIDEINESENRKISINDADNALNLISNFFPQNKLTTSEDIDAIHHLRKKLNIIKRNAAIQATILDFCKKSIQ